MNTSSKICSLLCVVFLISCATNALPKIVTADFKFRMLSDAVTQFLVLKKEGELPGLSKDDHGMLRSNTVTTKGSSEEVYPVHVILQVTNATGADSIYWYVLLKTDEIKPWVLDRAWKTDVQGENRHELFP